MPRHLARVPGDLRDVDPSFTDAPFRQILASSPDDIQGRFFKGLEKAGLLASSKK